MTKRILMAVGAILVVLALLVIFVEPIQNTVFGWFTSNTQVDDSNGTTEPTTESTDPTEGEKPTDPTDPTVLPEQEEDVLERPFTFEEFVKLATTDGAWNVAPEKATVYDLTNDEFVVESEEERNEFFAVQIRVNPYGAMSIVQNGFDSLENHAGEAVAPIFELCNCKVGHKDSWNDDMGQFHWHVAEGNHALGAKSWTRMTGEMQEYLMSYENREMIRNVACYWFVENEAGEQEIVYGIRVCGDQKDPEPPVIVEPEKQEFVISFNFVAANGNKLPNGVTSQLPKSVNVKEGETYKVNFTFKAVETEAGTWTFKSWDKTSVKVTGNVTITGTWTFTEKPGEGDAPEKEQYTVTYKFTGNNLPKEVTNLLPAAKTVEEGTKVNAPSIQSTVKVNGGTWSFNGWDKNTVTVTSNVTITGSWTFKAEEQPPVVKEYNVSYQFVGSKGESLPQEVLNQLPATIKVKEGTIVTPKAPAVQVIEVSNGTWTFVGYNKNSVNVTSDTVFTATWKFKEKLTLAPTVEDYLITFRVTCTNGNYSSNIKTPAAITAQKGETVKAPAMQAIIVVNGGKLVWNGWSASSITVVGDATIDGTYTYHADPKPEHTQPENDEDPNPIADNQDELDKLGERTDEVPQNTPEHSKRENLSLLPIGEEETSGEEINNQHSTPINDGARTDVDADKEEEKKSANNGLSLMPVEGENDPAEGGESGDLTLSLDIPVDDSEVADQATQDALNAMFGGRE